MSQWDIYIEYCVLSRGEILGLPNEEAILQFKQPNERAYTLFRELMQLIDITALDIQTLQYKPRALLASIMYLLLGKHYKQFSAEQILEEFPRSSYFLINEEIEFNVLFQDFLIYSFGFQLCELLPSVQYASTFFILKMNYDLPTAAKVNKENVLDVRKKKLFLRI